MKRGIAAILILTMLMQCAVALAEADDPFAGQWADPEYGRAALNISPDGEGYIIALRWGSSASTEGVWQMRATRDGDALRYTGGTMAELTYAEGGACVGADVQWQDAEGAFTLTEAGTLTWEDSREERAADFAFERTGDSDGRRWFAELAKLDEPAARLAAGETFTSVYYTDGYGFSTSEFKTEDPGEIAALWEALNRIEVVGRSQESITDWYPQIVFFFADGTHFNVTFEAHWLSVGGMENYVIANDGDFWALTAGRAQKRMGE